mmetsp:Transcript_47652/g.87587  ORF Transcript_47652/g.87587 Transcript_47652/m.87587 type:complete len:242 (+) Transcript_47652:384-1109(+)
MWITHGVELLWAMWVCEHIAWDIHGPEHGDQCFQLCIRCRVLHHEIIQACQWTERDHCCHTGISMLLVDILGKWRPCVAGLSSRVWQGVVNHTIQDICLPLGGLWDEHVVVAVGWESGALVSTMKGTNTDIYISKSKQFHQLQYVAMSRTWARETSVRCDHCLDLEAIQLRQVCQRNHIIDIHVKVENHWCAAGCFAVATVDWAGLRAVDKCSPNRYRLITDTCALQDFDDVCPDCISTRC